jgi:hypothetical protein
MVKQTRPIRQITDHPAIPIWQTFYECPSQTNKDTSYIVATNESEEWGCSCPRWKFKREECKHIRQVQLFVLFAKERSEDIAPVKLDSLPVKARKAANRFSLVEL